jgi:hypothetical protein
LRFHLLQMLRNMTTGFCRHPDLRTAEPLVLYSYSKLRAFASCTFYSFWCFLPPVRRVRTP